MHQKAFLNSFIRRINIKDSEAEIEYTCPIELLGRRRNEVLSMATIRSLFACASTVSTSVHNTVTEKVVTQSCNPMTDFGSFCDFT